MGKTIKHRSDCPVSCSLDIFGDKWSLLIIRDLIQLGPRTYGDFLKAKEKIATNILADRLSVLVEEGIIKKCPHPDSRNKALYKLTQMGIHLAPVLQEIYLWRSRYFAIAAEYKDVIENVKKDQQGFLRRLQIHLAD